MPVPTDFLAFSYLSTEIQAITQKIDTTLV